MLALVSTIGTGTVILILLLVKLIGQTWIRELQTAPDSPYSWTPFGAALGDLPVVSCLDSWDLGQARLALATGRSAG